MVRDCWLRAFHMSWLGILLHMRTCMPPFYIPVTARPIVLKLSVLLGTAWATTALLCIFRNAWAEINRGQRYIRPRGEMWYTFSTWMKPCIPPRTSNRPLLPPTLPRAWIQRVGTLRGREPWRRAVYPLLGLTSCSPDGPIDRPCRDWEGGRPQVDPITCFRAQDAKTIDLVNTECRRLIQSRWYRYYWIQNKRPTALAGGL